MLRSLRHDNIVTLLEAFRRKQKLVCCIVPRRLLCVCLPDQATRVACSHAAHIFCILQYLVFEYIEKNLLEVLEDSQSCLTPIQVHQLPLSFSAVSLRDMLSLHS